MNDRLALGTLLLALLSCLIGAPDARAQAYAIRLQLSFPDRAQHEMEVAVTFPALPEGALQIRMSRSSPGRYALHEFAKNVYSVRVTGRGGREVEVTRPDPHQWDVAGHGGEVTFRYTLFGDRVDGTYSAIDRTHAHLNAPASFAWARGLEDRPWEVRIDAPDEWPHVATQLPPLDDSGFAFGAPNLQFLLDSPIEVSDFDWYWWEIDERGRPVSDVRTDRPSRPGDRQQIRIALHHDGTEADARPYVEATQRIVEELCTVFGEAPRFDHGSYVFLADYLPWASGDGMEHRNSTVLSSSSSLRTHRVGLLGTVAHEFVHAWSIERLRPASLEPFDFERANMSGELWFGEGFTSYYDDVILARAGVLSADQMTQRFGGLVSFIVNSPARAYRGPIEMSRRAPFVDAAAWNDPTNDRNTFISYYSYGAYVGLALDLLLRKDHPGTSLDDMMRTAWRNHGRDEVPYTNADLERALAETIRDPEWARDFFARHVYGSEVPDLAPSFARLGMTLAPRAPQRATWGAASIDFSGRGLTLTLPAPDGSPLQRAGFSRRDVILQIDGEAPPQSRAGLSQLLGRHAPGDVLILEVQGRGVTEERRVTLTGDPSLELRLFETDGKTVDAETRKRRADWLGAGAER